MPGTEQPRPVPPATAVDLWLAGLDLDWPGPEALPVEERRRAGRILPATRRRRWAASRWALRSVLGAYLGAEPTAVELVAEPGGKPRLALPSPLRFNLTHSGALALIAICRDREVGVDLERIGDRPRAFYEAWVRREAVAKCEGSGLDGTPPAAACSLLPLQLPDGWTGALALAGVGAATVRRLESEPAARAALDRR